ncbi:ChaB family protein [Anabaena subtropica]|uniref:ChaB family protein n=1 Tax=Anabaena subtropica FACHB-260 TaxID=2692884 RepID=A0ABR8CQF4_9NOST|nr:ChaB family protein [Anabaena subtropica]MBD2344613.1 ChaB family protein [Anabaena subtropica FACHB-260]
MPEVYQAERTISAVFKEQKQVDDVIRRLLDRGVPRDHISVMGRNFQSETRIAGFITKRDVIWGGLRTGAIFGSLFGSFLSLLTGVGVLFIPFVGPIVAAGPISALLLGAASGAIAGSAGAGLVSVLTTLGMPEDKATIYQTRLQAGEFLLLTEVPSDRSGEFQLLLESAGGEEISTIDKTLTRPCPGPCNSPEDLSPEVRSHLSQEAQSTFIERYNGVLNETSDEFTAEQAAWEAIHQKFDEDENGVWSKAKVSV